MEKFEKEEHDFADRTQLSIQTLISEARASEGSSLSRSTQERDRPVFGPRDYKIDVIPSQMSLGVWKKWKDEIEIYVDTMGPSWRGVKFVLQQVRRLAFSLLLTIASMNDSFQKAKRANTDMDAFGPALVDYADKNYLLQDPHPEVEL